MSLGDDVECGDWKYRCFDEVGVLRSTPVVVVVVITLAELENGELARNLAANGHPLVAVFAPATIAVYGDEGDARGDIDEEDADDEEGLRLLAAMLALKSAAVSRLM